MAKYGMPYMGCKGGIADEIIEILPRGNRLVDLFGGGGAITHCAGLTNKWNHFYYNELNPLAVDLFKRSINGEFNYDKFTPEWIDRYKFKERALKDGYVAYVWSFGNTGDSYLFGEIIEPWKEAYFKAVFGDYSLLNKMDIYPPVVNGNPHDNRIQLMRWIKKNHDECKKKYAKYFIEMVENKKRDLLEIESWLKDVDTVEKLKEQKKILQDYMKSALKQSGLKPRDINEHTKTLMAAHWFGNSQWAFPTYDMYVKLQEILPGLDKDYYEITKATTVLQSLESLQRLQSLQRLESLQKLESLQSLQRLESLQRLQRLQRLESLQINCGSYLDYVYQDDDVVYCDPPYENTQQYTVGDFDSKAFYDWVASRPYPVYFSSYEISDDRFYKVLVKRKRNMLAAGGTLKYSNEYLYSNRPFEQEPDQLTLF